MSEFTDDQLKKFFAKKEEEYHIGESLDLQWKKVAKELPLQRKEKTVIFLFIISTAVLVYFLQPSLQKNDGGANKNLVRHQLVPPLLNSASIIEQSHQVKSMPVKKVTLEKNTVTDSTQRDFSKEQFEDNDVNRSSSFRHPNTTNRLFIIHLTERNFAGEVIRTIHHSEEKTLPKRWHLYAGIFVNSNRFVPNKFDEFKIESFSQSKNILKNRLGLRFSAEFPVLQTFVGKVTPSLSYSVFQKSYAMKLRSIYAESPNEYQTIEIRSFSHFVGIGLAFQLNKRFRLGTEYMRIFNNSKLKTVPYAKNIISFSLSVDLFKNETQVFKIRPFFQYAIPIGSQDLLRVFPMNIGMQAKF